MRRILALALVLALTLPVATAHLQGARPILQRTQRERIVDLQPDGLVVRAGLALSGEPLRHTVIHELDPARGRFTLEYREFGSVKDDAFGGRWEIARLVEYRDLNANGRFDPSVDTAAKAWRFTHYQWKVPLVQRVQVGGVDALSILWEGNLTGAPDIRMEAVVAGKDFSDEGVTVRPQDIALYLDFLDLPPRGVGNLFALELDMTMPDDASPSLHVVDETETGFLADVELQRALFVWGGEALLDDVETRLLATLDEARHVDGTANKTARLVVHLPTTDRSMRFVMVSGIEYGTESARSPLGMEVALLALVGVALALSRRRA